MKRTVPLLLSLLLVAAFSTGCVSCAMKTVSNLVQPSELASERINQSASEAPAATVMAAIRSPASIPTPSATARAESLTPEPTNEPSPSTKPTETPLGSPQPDDAFTVKFSDAKLVSNNNVGGDWTTTVEVEGQKLDKGGSMRVKSGSGDKIKIVCTAIEDDKIADVGKGTLSVDIASLKPGDNTFTVVVTVVEKGGRYAGNKAQWTFAITISR